MATVKAPALADHLEQDGLKPAYVLVGEDGPLVSECISLLKAAAEGPELPGTLVRDLQEPPVPSAVFDELRTLPFMGTPGVRLVIVRAGDQFIEDHGEAILAYLDRPSPTGVLVLCCRPAKERKERSEKRDGAPDNEVEDKQKDKANQAKKRPKEVMKAVARVGVIVDCGTPRWGSAKDWLRAEARKAGKTATPAAVDALLEAVGPELMVLRCELEKLVLFVGDETTISERDVDEVTSQSRSRSVFELSDAIASSDAAKALSAGERLLLKGEKPEALIAFLGRQMRSLAQVKTMLEDGADQRQIARELFKGRDFAARKAVQAVRRLPDEWFTRQMGVLAAADADFKTTSVVTREHGIWMSGLLVRLCQRE